MTTCPKCKAVNKIVNQCGCDPNNLPTKLPALTAVVRLSHPLFAHLAAIEVNDNERGEYIQQIWHKGDEVSVRFTKRELPDTILELPDWMGRHAAISIFSNVPALHGRTWVETSIEVIDFVASARAQL